eukprot:gene12139-16252_t
MRNNDKNDNINRKAHASDLCGEKIFTAGTSSIEKNKLSRVCYFDRTSLCTSSNTCPLDDRPCNANRDYFDHIYGPPDSPTDSSGAAIISTSKQLRFENNNNNDNRKQESSNDNENDENSENKNPTNSVYRHYKYLSNNSFKQSVNRNGLVGQRKFSVPSSTSSNKKNHDHKSERRHETVIYKKYATLSKKERRRRRQKLFIMSTWLEDLLPDPHQGHSWMLNSVVDFTKISFRAALILVTTILPIPKPKIIHFDEE